MLKLQIDPNNPASVVSSVREFLQDQQSVYAGMIEQFPEAIRGKVADFKTKIDAALTTLASKPTEQVPAALDASYLIRQMNYMAESFTDMLNGAMESVRKMVDEYTPKANALQSLQGRIEKKELLEAADVQKQIEDAVAATRTAERERATLLNTRRQTLAKADVPLPLTDEALEGDETAFESLKTKAGDRAKKLKDLGQVSAMNAEDLAKLIYGADEAFNFVVSVAEKAAKSKGQEADPMLGGRTETGKRRHAIA